jgi:glucosamine--fructose-6-phosphate aminotransferase (isomerizing)
MPARVPVEIDIASEFRYRAPDLKRSGVSLFISQSGETLDTLEAMRFLKKQGATTLALVNQPESTMAREADAALMTLAGPEIGVASTKAFTTQLAVLACFTLALGRARGTIDQATEARLAKALIEVPRAGDQDAGPGAAYRRARERHRRGAGRALSRPRPLLSAGARRRAQA